MIYALRSWKTAALYLVSLVVAFALLTSCISKTYHDTIVEQYNRTASIMVVCSTGPVMGSGVVTGKDTILTAYHVVDCDGAVLVIVGGKTEHVGTITKFSRERDIATLNVPGVNSVAVVGPEPIAGDRLCVSPGWPTRNRVCGEVFYEQGKTQSTKIRFGAIVQPGNSGAGVYDSHGRLVGILTVLTRCVNGQICGAGMSPLDVR